MPRTGQPSTRDVEATVRAVEILDVLAEGGELGTTDVSRRTGISASTVSRQLGTLTRVGLVEHVAATGPLPARRADAPLRERGARPAQPPRPRPPPPRGARAPGRRDGDALDPRRQRRDHRRLRADRPLPAGRDAARPPERRPRIVGRQGDARLRRRAAAARQARGVHAADDHRPGRPGGGDRARPRAGLRRGDRGARGRPQRRRRPRSGTPAATSPRSSRCRARRAASTPTRSPPRCRSSSPARSGSPSRSAGTSSVVAAIPPAAIASRRGRFGLDTTPPASVDTRCHGRAPVVTTHRGDQIPIAGSERGGARGNRSRPLCRRGGPRRPDRRGPASHRRRGRDVHLLPIRLGHGPDHGQGRPRRALGEHGREGIPARLRLDRQPLHRPARELHRLRPRGRGARRPARARDLRGAPLGPQGRARLVHVLPQPRGARGRRLVPHLRLPRQPEADPGRLRGEARASTSAPAPSPR